MDTNFVQIGHIFLESSNANYVFTTWWQIFAPKIIKMLITQAAITILRHIFFLTDAE